MEYPESLDKIADLKDLRDHLDIVINALGDEVSVDAYVELNQLRDKLSDEVYEEEDIEEQFEEIMGELA